jgi:hypothetical protein
MTGGRVARTRETICSSRRRRRRCSVTTPARGIVAQRAGRAKPGGPRGTLGLVQGLRRSLGEWWMPGRRRRRGARAAKSACAPGSAPGPSATAGQRHGRPRLSLGAAPKAVGSGRPTLGGKSCRAGSKCHAVGGVGAFSRRHAAGCPPPAAPKRRAPAARRSHTAGRAGRPARGPGAQGARGSGQVPVGVVAVGARDRAVGVPGSLALYVEGVVGGVVLAGQDVLRG